MKWRPTRLGASVTAGRAVHALVIRLARCFACIGPIGATHSLVCNYATNITNGRFGNYVIMRRILLLEVYLLDSFLIVRSKVVALDTCHESCAWMRSFGAKIWQRLTFVQP